MYNNFLFFLNCMFTSRYMYFVFSITVSCCNTLLNIYNIQYFGIILYEDAELHDMVLS